MTGPGTSSADMPHRIKMQARSYNNYIKTVIGTSLTEGDNQNFFFVRLNKSENLGLPVLISPKGLHITDSDKLEAPNTQFTSVFTEDDGKDLLHLDPGTHPPMEDFLFTQPGIERLLSKLQPNKAGPNELLAHVLKKTSSQIAAVVTVIFQQYYEQDILPEDWLNANVSVFSKKGEKASPANYCPVSLTSILHKTMEHILTPARSIATLRLITTSTWTSIWLLERTILWDPAYQYPPGLDL